MRARLLLLAFGAAFAFGSCSGASAAGPSFDCAKAAAPVEKLICADPALGDLDKALSEALQSAIGRGAGDARSIRGDERRWLVARDKACPAAAPGAADCLKKAYRERIDEIDRRTSPSAPLCARLADSFRKVLGDRDFDAENAGASGSVLAFMAASKASGVTLAAPLADDLAGPKAAMAFVMKQNPGLKLSSELEKALHELSDDSIRILPLPQTSIAAAVQSQGTMHCTAAVLFDSRQTPARSLDPPPNWQGDSCMTSAVFGTLDGAPIAFTDGTNEGSALTDRVTAAPWAGGRFADFCAVSFHYAPRFDFKPLNPSDDVCSAPDCAALKAAALRLVEAVQRDPQQVAAQALAALSDAERKSFEAASEAPSASAPAKAKPEDILDQDPLRVPVVVDGALYRASVGHATIGWRTFADWTVTFEAIGADGLGKPKSIDVGMHKGRLVSTSSD